MKKIYADTSVIGGCFDKKYKEHSRRLFEIFKTGYIEMIFSDLTLTELASVRQEIKNKVKEVPIAFIIEAKTTEEVLLLAKAYMAAEIVTEKSYHDVVHIALATVYKADTIVSWNFISEDHIKEYNKINLQMGYGPVNIHTPTAILKTISYEEREQL